MTPRCTEPDPPAAPKKATPLRVARIVFSGLFMIGQNRDFAPEAPKIDPVHLILGAVTGFALIVGALVWLVITIVR